MRTNELHASPRQVQRSDGRGAVRSAAYRSASHMYDERLGIWHDYTRKQGVEFTRLYTPADAPDWARDRAMLWNAAEAKENRKNSMTAREWVIAFPHEFNIMQRREAGDALAHEIMARTGAAVEICYHRPDRHGDQRNFHAHVLYTTRGFDPKTPDGWSKTKYRNFSQDQIEVDGEKKIRASVEVNHMRAFIAGEMNRIAARDGLEVHTEHLSFEARGIEREPTRKLGPAATEMERKGQRSKRGDENRAIRAANENRKALAEEKKIVDLAIEREKRRLAREATKEPPAPDPRQQKETDLLAARDRAAADLSKVNSVWSRLFHRKAFEAAYTQMQEAERQLEAFRLSDEKAKAARSAFEKVAPDSRERQDQPAVQPAHRSTAAQERPPPVVSLKPSRKPGLSSADEWEDAGRQILAQEPRKATNQNKPQDSPAGSLRSSEDIAASVQAQGWKQSEPDILDGLKPAFKEQAREALHQAEVAPDNVSDGERHDHGPSISQD